MLKSSWFIVSVGFATIWLTAETASAQTDPPTVMSPDRVAVSQPLTQGVESPGDGEHKVRTHFPLPHHGTGPDHDDVLQSASGSKPNSKIDKNFAGVGANGFAPPDTNMAVGPNTILQTVNSRYAVYNKNGVLLTGPFTLSSIWTGLGSMHPCAVNNAGDVVAQYDKLADRFIVTQLGGTSGPFYECIAISQTSDPAGAYFLYSFPYGSLLNDYPKFGVWPTATNSAYLATYNLFSGQNFAGGQICAYDRAKMLVGDPSAQAICYTVPGGGYLPSDLDGSTPPVDGTPGFFLSYQTLNSLRMYALTPNFSNPSASSYALTGPDIPVAAFSEPCFPSGTCVPQPNTNQKLDSLGDRLMYRLAFRNFGDHEALVVNHSIVSGSSVGVRWYELRAPVGTSGGFGLFQQGTFAPDSTYRWMGSAAMDAAGNIGIGYSASSSSVRPSIRYTGRLVSDPLGTMEAEVTLVAGAGSQTQNLSRWGDYTAMRIDPSDDCTFWYTNEYLVSNGSFNWSTAFGSFKFPSCNAPDFSISASPSSLTLVQGTSGNSTVTVTALNGLNGSVGLAVTGCPSGATCSLATPVNPNPAATSTLMVSTAGANTGPYTLTITGTKGALVHTTTVSLTINSASASVNVALASNGGTAAASSSFNNGYAPGGAINGDRKGLSWGSGGGWNDATQGQFPDWLEVDFNGVQTINEIDLYTVQDNYLAPGDPTPSMTFSLYGLRDFEVQYWNGGAWVPIPGGSVTGNNLVWRKFTFNAVATSKIRVWSTGSADGSFSRITELEAYTGGIVSPDFSISASPPSLTVAQGGQGTSTVTVTALNGFSGNVDLSVTGCPPGVCSLPTPVSLGSSAASTLTISTTTGTSTGTFPLTITGTQGALIHSTTVSLTINPAGTSLNVALAGNGGSVVASSTFSSAYPESSVINGDRKGLSWGNGGGWNDGTPGAFPDSLEVHFAGTPTINEIDIFTIQDNYAAPADPTLSMTFSSYGLRDFEVQYWNGAAFVPIPGGTVTGNNFVWRQFMFSAVSTSKIRLVTNGSADGAFSRVTEIEAYTGGTVSPDFSISASPASLTLAQGNSGTSTVTVTALNGFSGNVDLSVTGCPSAATCSIPTPVSPTATPTLNITTALATPTGPYTLTITGTQGALVHSTTVSLTVIPAGTAVNVALAANGGSAVASSTYNSGYSEAGAINGDRKGLSWGSGGGWNDGTAGSFPDTLEIHFTGTPTIGEIDVFTLQDNYASPIDPTLSTTFTLYGIRDFEVQYWNGGAWVPVSGGTVTGNNHVWNKFTFSPIATTKIRVVVTGTADGVWTRITEVEAY